VSDHTQQIKVINVAEEVVAEELSSCNELFTALIL